MKYADLANAGVLAQPVYEPGKPIDYVAREFGLDASKIAKLASNENPYGPSPKAAEAGRLAMSAESAIIRSRGVSKPLTCPLRIHPRCPTPPVSTRRSLP